MRRDLERIGEYISGAFDLDADFEAKHQRGDDGKFASAADGDGVRRDTPFERTPEYVAKQRAEKAAHQKEVRQSYKERSNEPAEDHAVESVGRLTDSEVRDARHKWVVMQEAEQLAYGAPKKYRERYVKEYVKQVDERRRKLTGVGLE